MSKHKTVGDVPPDLSAALARLQAAAPKVVAKIAELKDQVKTNMTAAEVTAFKGELDTVSEAFEAIVQ